MKNITTFCLILLMSFSVFGQFNYNVTTSSEEIEFKTINAPDGKQYDAISFSKTRYYGEPGQPRIPMKQIRYVLPENAGITDIQINERIGNPLKGAYSLYPAQEYIPRYEEPDFSEPDERIYKSTNPFPGKFGEIVKDEYYQGYHIVTVAMYPLQYTPGKQQLVLYENMTINFTHSAATNTPQGTQSLMRHNNIRNTIKAMVDNPDDVDLYSGGVEKVVDNGNQNSGSKSMPTYEGPVPDYIIITSREADNGGVKTEFERFAAWKNKKGVPTQIVFTEDISQNYKGVDLAEKIHNYLQDMRLKWGTGLFVLLGGDVNIIPARYATWDGKNRVTDMYYCDVYNQGIDDYNWNSNGDTQFDSDGYTDLSPDNIIGRAPVEDSDETAIFVNKVIQYEKLLNVTTQAYVNNVLLIGAHYNHPPTQDFYGQVDWMNPAYDLLPQNIQNTAWRIYDDYNYTTHLDTVGDEELTRLAVLNALNDGGSSSFGNFHLVAHFDHGSPYKIGTSNRHKSQSLSMADAGGVSNGNYLQIMYTAACEPNEFQKDCFSERYMNNPDGGAVAFIGNSGMGSPLSEEQCLNFFSSIYNINDDYPDGYILGNCFAFTRDATPDGPIQIKNMNLLGDPEMPIWNAAPSQMNLVSSSFNSSTQEVNATVGGLSAGDVVRFAVYKENEVICFKTDTASGTQLNFNIINVNPHTNGSLYLTATSQNYIPLQDSIQVNITGKHLYTTSQFFDDDNNGQSIGNNDSLPDAGESIEMKVSLKNSGTVQAQNVSAVLCCLTDSCSNYLSISENSASYPDIAAGQTQESSTPYVFTLENDIGETRRLHFQLDITADGSYSTTHDFYFDAYMPQVLATDKYVLTGDFNSGETVTFNIELSNEGNASLTGLTARLNTTDYNVYSYDETFHNYPDIEEYGRDTAGNPYFFTLIELYIPGDHIIFDVIMENAYGKTWTNTFDFQGFPPDIDSIKTVGSQHSIYLEWYPLDISSINGYNVYRSPSDANGNDLGQYEKLNIKPLTSSCFRDDGLDKLTIYHYKIAAVSLSGIEGNKTHKKAWTSWPQATNWPVIVNLEENTSTGSVQISDINDDGYKELFMQKRGLDENGALLGLWSHGEEIFDIDNNNTTQQPMHEWPNADAIGTPAIADINNDGILDIVSLTGWTSDTASLVAYSLNANNTTPDLLFDIQMDESHNYRGPAIADLDNDGTKEIVIVRGRYGGIRDMVIYSHTGTPEYIDQDCGVTMGTPAIADMNNNGYKEIIVGLNHPNITNGVYRYKYNGIQWYKNCIFSDNSRDFDCFPAIADFNYDGNKEVVITSNDGTTSYINIVDVDGNFYGNWSDNSKTVSFSPTSNSLSGISIGNLDNDNLLEIVALGNQEIKIWKSDGSLYLHKNNPDFDIKDAIPVLSDVDGDSEIEVIFPDGEYLNAINPTDGNQVLGFPLALLSGSTNHNASVSDINNDGFNEVVINEGTSAYIWETDGKSSRNEWPLIRSQSNNCGEYVDYCTHSGEQLTINSDITWNSRKVHSDIFIENGHTMTIAPDAEILIQPDADIIVEGALILEQGASIKSKCSSAWHGNMIAQNEGSIIFKNNSTIELSQNGKIFIDYEAMLSVYLNSTFFLENDNTCIEIAGDLHIASNATFTFTGDGYIKFSNPGGDATNNIFCGTNSSFVLQGSGQNDKIMEVQQSTVKLIGVPQ